MPNLEERLRKLYLQLPEHARPPLKHGYRWVTLHSSALATRKSVVDSRRVEFLDYEIANLEPFGFLSPSAGEVLVETHVSLVSPGTERGILTGLPGTARRFPFRPGYSAAGVVRAVGPGVTKFAPGDRVAGGFPHASRVNVSQDLLVKTPANVSDEEASFVVLGMIAQQGIRKAAILPGERVAVVGQGLLGQLSNRLVRILTPGRLVGIGASRRRESIARDGGVHDYVALDERALDLSSVAADVVIEIAGTPDSMATALACAAPGGRVVVVGSTRALDRHVDWHGLVQQKGLQIVGAHMSLVPSAEASPTRWTFVQEIGLFLDLIARGLLRVSNLVTARPSPEDCNDVYDRLTRFPSEHIGIAFQWGEATNGAPGPTTRPRPGASSARHEGRDMEPLRIGIVGAGAIGRHNALGVQQSSAAKVVGVFDTNLKVARGVASQVSAKVHESYEALLADPEIEAVLLSVPHHLHRDMTVQAAASGKHLLLEKPLANTVEEADAMLAACRRAGTLCTVNFSFRYLPQFQAARALVEAGAVGDITGVQVATYSYREAGYWLGARSQSVDNWRTDKTKAGAGFLFMNLCHVIDYVHYITGLKTERVYAEYGTLGSPTEVEDSVSISCRFRKGAIGSFSGSTVRRGANEAEDRIWGSHGSIAIVGETLSYYSTRPINGTRPGKTHRQTFSRNNWTAEWVTAFAHAVRSSGTPAITLRDGWENIAFIEAALKSMEQGRALSVPAFEEQ